MHLSVYKRLLVTSFSTTWREPSETPNQLVTSKKITPSKNITWKNS